MHHGVRERVAYSPMSRPWFLNHCASLSPTLCLNLPTGRQFGHVCFLRVIPMNEYVYIYINSYVYIYVY